MKNIMENMDVIIYVASLVSLVISIIGPILYKKAGKDSRKKKIGYVLSVYAIIAVITWCLLSGTADSRTAFRYRAEYSALKAQLEDVNDKFGGISEHQYQLATNHNMETLPDTWIIKYMWHIDDRYKIDLSKYKILKIEIKDQYTNTQTHERETL